MLFHLMESLAAAWRRHKSGVASLANEPSLVLPAPLYCTSHFTVVSVTAVLHSATPAAPLIKTRHPHPKELEFS